MALQQYFKHEWRSIPGAENSENLNGCFDCSICLDFAHEPVVTLCGHLYCWPCIYKWLHVQSASLASDEHPQCPVCKADISHTTMTPLYGRGQTTSEYELSEPEGKTLCWGMAIPPRPSAFGTEALASPSFNTGQQQFPYRNPYQNQHYNPQYNNYDEDSSASPMLNLTGTTTGLLNPMVGMFGEMVFARVFRNSNSIYAYPNSYHLMGGSNPRMRRQEIQTDKSLNRISIFLICCAIICFIVF